MTYAFELVIIFNAFLSIPSLWLPMVDIRKENFFALLDRPVCYHELAFAAKFDVGVRVARVIEKIRWEEEGCPYSNLLSIGDTE